MKTAVTAMLCVFLLTGATGTPAAPRDRDGNARGLVAAAEQAMTAERFQEAMELYGQAGELMPDAAEIPFNMGVAAYRAGELERASELFDRARTLAADPSMQARAAYNLGTTSARQGRESKMDDPAVAQAQMSEATASLETALDRFRDTIAMNPDDEDARANGELAWRWLKQLEELQDQMQQQGGPQQEGEEEQDDQEQQQQDEQQQQGEQPQSGEQDQQEQPQQGDEQEEQQQPQGGDEQQEQEEEDPQPTTGEEETDERNQDQASADEKPMSREEAERLLQSVRDKEAQRREELAREEARKQRPVDKDW